MPSDSQSRDQRLEVIRELIKKTVLIRSQSELQKLLREKGFQTTQSSLSRDLKELGIQRINGRYVSASLKDRGDGGFMNWGVFLERFRPSGPYITVLETAPGAARMVAQEIDGCGWPEVAGTLAGEDTIFVTTPTQEDQDRLLERLTKYRQVTRRLASGR